MDDLTGRLVVATHELADRNFRRTVVLLLAHDPDEGAAGVILNRPSAADVPDRLEPWLPAIAPPAVLFLGGPVGRDTVIAVAAAGDDPGLDDWQPITGGLGVIDLSGDAALIRPQLRSLRLFAGYAGWGGGQLESEIASGAWFVIDADAEDVRSAAPDGLWRAVLARQGGLFTTVPDDPALN